MTTEKEFWEFAGRYFRTVTSIKDIIDDLRVGVGLSKDVRAIKAMKRVENIMKDFDEQKPQDISIDEGCVGCAGPCMVVDVSANLQKELDDCSNMNSSLHEELGAIMCQLTDSRNRCGYLSTQLGLRESEIYDLRMYHPDNFWAVIAEKDSMIRRQGKIIEDFKTIETCETDRLHKIIKDQKRTIDHFINSIGGLEAELSTRKEDSAVFMKVVEIVREWDNSTAFNTLLKISDELSDYLNAPEGPPETPIDDDQDIAIVFTFGEIL